MKVRINATGDTIVMTFLRPNADTKLEGYILGYGSSMFSKQFIQLPENGQPYETEFDAEPKYLIAVQPIPTNEVKKQCTGKVELQKPLHLVIGSVTPTSVLLSWGTLLKTPYEGNIMNECLEDGHYTVRYREKNRKWNYQTCPTSDTVIDNLKPNVVYEFGVQPNAKDATGMWSRPVIHNISTGGIEDNPGEDLSRSVLPPFLEIPLAPKFHPPLHITPTMTSVPFPHTNVEGAIRDKHEGYSLSQPQQKPITQPLPNLQLQPHYRPPPQPKPQPQQPQLKSHVTAQPQPKTYSQNQPQSQPLSTSQPITNSRPQHEPESEPIPKTQPQPEPTSKLIPKSQPQQQPRPTSQTVSHTQPQPQPTLKIIPQTHTQPPPKSTSKHIIQTQSQPTSQPIIQTQSQPTSQPIIQTQSHPTSQPTPQTQPQLQTTSQYIPQIQPQPLPQPTSQFKHQTQSQPPPKSTSKHIIQTQSQPQPTSQPTPQTQPQLQTTSQFTPQTQPQTLPLPTSQFIHQTQSQPQPQPTSQPIPQTQPQLQPQPTFQPIPLTPSQTQPQPPLLTKVHTQSQTQSQQQTHFQSEPQITTQLRSQSKPETQPQPKSKPQPKPIPNPKKQPKPHQKKQQKPQPKPKSRDQQQPQAKTQTQTLPPSQPIPQPHPSSKTQTASRPQSHPQLGPSLQPQTGTYSEPTRVTPREKVPTGTGILRPSIAEVPRSPISSSVPAARRNTTLSRTRVHSTRIGVRPVSPSKTLTSSHSSSTPGADGTHHRANALPKPVVWSKENPGKDKPKTITFQCSSFTNPRGTVTSRRITHRHTDLLHPPIPVNKRPNLVGKPSDHDKPMDLKQGDKESILKPFPLVTAKPKQERRQQTATSAPAVNSSHFDIYENSSIFRPLPASDIDIMGKKRFVAPHVIYKTDKKPDEPCSITSSLSFFPDEEGSDQNVTGPPRIPPSNLTVVTVEGCPSFVILDWQKSDNETREYEVVSTAKGPNGQEVSILTTNQTHTAVENLKPESNYEFKVTPKNELGTGPSTDPVTFSTESADPRVSEYVAGKDAIWTQFPFKADAYSECNGKQFVKRTWYRKFVGIQLCNSLRYKIYLSDSLNGKFYHIGDQTGHGEDHCQFVDSFLDGRTGTQMLADQLPSKLGFFRALRQEPVHFGEIGGKSHITYVGWYECGTPIPGKW
ncbi:putative target of Nesh-SH3-like [Scophthalmus maximus]|uniref:Putative target of Nesh-SH3-like n=1 Tax=Scophthalmus maximus TaxID=52904 RepID=A0A2U9CCH0_SCOMX|nr:putative target of Nesh-SH3-like [Scophthalmus maximus]